MKEVAGLIHFFNEKRHSSLGKVDHISFFLFENDKTTNEMKYRDAGEKIISVYSLAKISIIFVAFLKIVNLW